MQHPFRFLPQQHLQQHQHDNTTINTQPIVIANHITHTGQPVFSLNKSRAFHLATFPFELKTAHAKYIGRLDLNEGIELPRAQPNMLLVLSESKYIEVGATATTLHCIAAVTSPLNISIPH